MSKHDAFNKWRARTCNTIPALATRVFALRDVYYLGCGYHWNMERSLGVCLARLNDYDSDMSCPDGPIAKGKQVVLRALVEELCKQVIKAEASAVDMNTVRGQGAAISTTESKKQEHAET
jgi:hypothetical protein